MKNEFRDAFVTAAFSRATEGHSLRFAIMIQDPQLAAGVARKDHIVSSCGNSLLAEVKIEWHSHNQSLLRLPIRNCRRRRRQPGEQHQHRRHFQHLLCHLSSSTPFGSLADASTVNFVMWYVLATCHSVVALESQSVTCDNPHAFKELKLIRKRVRSPSVTQNNSNRAYPIG